MAISIRSETTGSGTGVTGGTLTIWRPASISNEDYVVVILGVGDDVPVIAAPSGWIEINKTASSSGNDRQIGAFCKRVANASTEPMGYTFSVGSGDLATWWCGVLSGVDDGWPLEYSRTSNQDNASSPYAPEIYLPHAGSFVLAAWSTNYDDSVTMPGGNWTTRANNVIMASSSALNVASQTFSSSGSTGAPTVSGITATQETSSLMVGFRQQLPNIKDSQPAYMLGRDTLPGWPITDAAVTHSNSGYNGPVRDANGNLYVALVDKANDHQLEVWKSTDNGITWVEQDAANKPDSNDGTDRGGIKCVYVFPGPGQAVVNDRLYIATSTDGEAAMFHVFRLSTATTPDTWETVDKLVAAYTNTGTERIISLTLGDTANDILIVGASEVHGTNEDTDYHYSTNGGTSWTASQVFDDGSDSYDSLAGWCFKGPVTGDVYGMWMRDDTSEGYIRWADDVDQSFSSSQDFCDYTHATDVANYVFRGMAYQSGTHEHAVLFGLISTTYRPRSTYIVDQGSSPASTEVSTTGVHRGGSSPAGHSAAMCPTVYGTKVYLVFASETSRDLYIVSNPDNTTWGSQTLISDGTTVDFLSASTPYIRSNKAYIGIVWDESGPEGTTRFIEYLLGTVITDSQPAYINGKSSTQITDSTPAYLKGKTVATDQQPCYLKGKVSSTDQQPAYMRGCTGTILDIDHDGGSLDEYTSTLIDSGDLSVTRAAALVGSPYGMSILIDDTNLIYGQYLFSPVNTSTSFRARMYIDPNSMTMANSNAFRFFGLYSDVGVIASLELGYVTGSGYRLQAFAWNDAGVGTAFGATYVTDAPHCVEIRAIKATSSTAEDAQVEFWIDGSSVGSVTNIDCFYAFANLQYIRLGAVLGLDAGTSGTFYLDELVVNDSGLPIGPITWTEDNQPAYLKGGSSATDSQPAYLVGTSAGITDQQPAYLQGAWLVDTHISWIMLRVPLDRGFPIAKQPAYLQGVLQVTDQQPAYIKGKASSIDQQPGYLQGKAATTDNQPAFIRGCTGVVLDIDHEDGTLGEYAGTSTASGDLSVTRAAALAGSKYGMQSLIDDTTNRYGYTLFSPATTSGITRVRAYIDPNGLSMVSGNEFGWLGLSNTTSGFQYYAQLYFRYTAGAYQVNAEIYNDAAVGSNAIYTVTDEPHCIEIKVIRSSGSAANNGSMELWIDGVSKEVISGIDNYDRFYQTGRVSFGVWYQDYPQTSGTVFLDQLVVNDSGLPIGPITWSQDAQPAYLAGGNTASDSQPAYIKGRASLTDSQPGYLRGKDAQSDSSAAYLAGKATAIDQQPAYLKGKAPALDSQTAYLKGRSSLTDSQSAYLAVQATIVDSQPAYLQGTAGSTTSSQTAYSRGSAVALDQQPSYLKGKAAATDNQSAYLQGTPGSTTDQQPAYLKGKQQITDAQSGYVLGKSALTDSTAAYLKGQATSLDSQPAYIKGKSTTVDSQPVYLKARAAITDQQAAYLQGVPGSVTDQQAVYLSGKQLATDAQPGYIRGKSSLVDSTPAYLKGKALAIDQQPGYLKGKATVTDQQPAYLIGRSTQADSTAAYLRGQTGATDLQGAYLQGRASLTDNTPGYLKGSVTVTDSQGAYLTAIGVVTASQQAFLQVEGAAVGLLHGYLNGVDTATDQQAAFLQGSAAQTDSTPAYLSGVATETGVLPAYANGQAEQAGAQPACLQGKAVQSDSQPAFTQGRDSLSDSQPGHLHGQDTAAGQQPGYLSGQSQSTDQTPAYLRGKAQLTGQLPAYLKGSSSMLDQQPACIVGQEQITSQTGSYLAGSAQTTDRTGAYLYGQGVATGHQPVYLQGITYNEAADQQPAYLIGKSTITAQQASYERGADSSSAQQPAYLSAQAQIDDAQQGYLAGQSTATASQPATLTGGEQPVGSQSAYLQGKAEQTDQQPGYTHGQASTIGSSHAYLVGKGESSSSQTAYLIGQSAATGQQPGYLEGGEPVTNRIPAYLYGNQVVTGHVRAFIVRAAYWYDLIEATLPIDRLAEGNLTLVRSKSAALTIKRRLDEEIDL